MARLRRTLQIAMALLLCFWFAPGVAGAADAFTGAQLQIAQAVSPDDYARIAGSGSGDAVQDGPTLEDYARVAEEVSMLSETQLSFDRVRERFIRLVAHTPEFSGEVSAALREKSPTGRTVYFLALVFWTLVFLGVAHLVEKRIYGKHLVGPWFIGLQRPNPRGIVEKLPVLAIRAALGIVGIAISAVIAGILVAVTVDPSEENGQKTVIVTIATVSAIRASAIIWRMVLAPYLSAYRLPCLGDAEARRLFRWLWVSVTISFGLLALCYWLEDLDVGHENHALVTLLASMLTVAINVAMVLVNREAITAALLGGDCGEPPTWMQKTFAAIWSPLAILYFFGGFAVLSYRLLAGKEVGAPLIVGAYTILLAAIVAYGIVAFVIARIFQHRRAIVAREAVDPAEFAEADDAARIVTARNVEGDPITPEGDEESGPSATPPDAERREIAPRLRGMRDFEDLARRTASIFAVGSGIYALIYIWGFGFLLEEGRLLDRAEDLVDICLVGYVLYHAVRIAIDMKIAEEGGFDVQVEPGDEGGGASAASRLATLLPLFRNFLLFTILMTIVLMALLEIGVNVGPLFAGAGVVGLAIGFGAQTLIRDILSGAFYLIDDAFRKGEYIDIGSVKGTVEKISVRSFQLRHHLGALHTVPFGEITHLTNYSRDWVMVKLPVRVTYDTDVEKVRKLVKNLGQELLEHPVEGPKFLQPLKSQGVYRMEDSAMIIRVKFMTRPGDQWTTRKLVYARLRELFEENGIKFAHREVTVRLPGREPGSLSQDEQEAVAAAARVASDVADEAAVPPPRLVPDYP